MGKKKKEKGDEFLSKTITIKKYQEVWIEKNFINLSRLVQSKLDEMIENEKRRISKN